ncbi:MAG: 4-hydroxy-tetrahydrodipicolinate reductase [bacterium]|nr:4-hydroxy-tetrahydrodipicolinate reductase [bacterium]
MINVAVCGANGKMGQAVVNAVNEAEDMTLIAKIDIYNGEFSTINDAKNSVKIDVLVDFTQPSSVYENALYCLNNNIATVIGTTGLTDIQIAELKDLSIRNKTACLIAPNFSTGAVLLMQFAQMASKYFENAEIIELHHNQKKDAPSGTAVKTAFMMSEENSNKSFISGNCAEKETISGARGASSYNDIHIHSVRMPGYMASQEVLFGSNGQILTLRHDSTNRECYMPGVMLAVRHVAENSDFIYGLENIM